MIKKGFTPIVIPTVGIYFDEIDKHYLVQPCIPSPLGGSLEFGDPIMVLEEDFESSIANVTLKSLENYLKTKYDPTLEKRRSDKEQLDFVKRHKSVSVAKLTSGRIQVSAGERQGGGYHGVEDGDIVIDAASAREQLPGTIREAFQRAK